MQTALPFLRTTIGKKALMAVTGLILFGFVIGHMVGNLQIYLGAEKLDGYAEKLQSLGPLLWLVRSVLLTALLIHLWAMFSLYGQSWSARDTRYQVKRNSVTSYAATTMWLSGPMILLFVLYHLAHFTFPGIAMGEYEHVQGAVFANVVSGFSVPWVSALYVAAQAILGLHLYHGAWSLMQTLGLDAHPKHDPRRRLIARLIAMVIVVGNVSIPVAVMTGYIQ
jgi:succinate dehydrogenase / fumarate reductase cytochrome b subunit